MKQISSFLLACGILVAQAPQAPNPTSTLTATVDIGVVPIYRVTVVARTMKAINYNHRSGSTHIGFSGTALMPQARGEARVESKQGVIKIDADMQKLTPATQFGPEYLTYVMWAITPEGRATNVGEVLLNGDHSKLNATTELQSFGLIVTAEPYFAVTQPSDVVVMENVVIEGTVGTIEQLEAKYELLPRGQYVMNVNPSEIKAPALDRKVPLELYEARNAVQIARWMGADRYASDTFQKALDGLTNAEGYLVGKAGSKPIGTVAREAVQMAEDARIITIKKMQQEQLASERKAGKDREARAESAQVSAEAETERAKAAAQMAARQHTAEMTATQLEAERVKRNSEFRATAAESEMDRLKRENAAQALTAKTDAERVKAENAAQALTAQNNAEQMKRENAAQALSAQTDAERMKAENAAQALTAQNEADRTKRDSDARMAAAQSEADRLKELNSTQAAKAQGESARLTAMTDQLKTDSAASILAAKAETERQKSANIAQAAAAKADADRLKAENDANSAAARNEADRLKRENDAQRTASQASLDRAAADKAQAETEKTALRAQLLAQFNAVLQTRDTARGLIVNMSDVLFDTGKYSLRPQAREKLARVAGIFVGHPGLRLEVEGFTDSIGGEDYNQHLSENRAGSVRDYLTEAGIPLAAVTAKGFGKTLPVASNMTAAGRQQNRRVELVVSGDIIGAEIRASIVDQAK